MALKRYRPGDYVWDKGSGELGWGIARVTEQEEFFGRPTGNYHIEYLAPRADGRMWRIARPADLERMTGAEREEALAVLA